MTALAAWILSKLPAWASRLPWKWIFIGLLVAALTLYRWNLIHSSFTAGYQQAKREEAPVIATALAQKVAAERRAKEADQNAIKERALNLAAVSAEYSARQHSYIRLCVAAPSASALPETGTDSSASNAGASASGVLQAGTGQNSVAYYDTKPLYDLAEQCDKQLEDFRALEKSAAAR